MLLAAGGAGGVFRDFCACVQYGCRFPLCLSVFVPLMDHQARSCTLCGTQTHAQAHTLIILTQIDCAQTPHTSHVWHTSRTAASERRHHRTQSGGRPKTTSTSHSHSHHIVLCVPLRAMRVFVFATSATCFVYAILVANSVALQHLRNAGERTARRQKPGAHSRLLEHTHESN